MSEEEIKAIDYLKNDVVYWLDKGKDFVVIDIGENEKLHSILNLTEKQQKEIEEKNIAINKMSRDISKQLEEIEEKSTIIMAGAEKVKQLEKEIEKLKFDNHMIKKWNEQLDKNCISKDKIREKIKSFQDVKKEIIKNENKLSRASITYDIVRNDYCEKMLQELLEEK